MQEYDEYGRLVMSFIGVSFDPTDAHDDINRLAAYLTYSNDCQHQMLSTFTYFAERARSETRAVMYENLIDLLTLMRKHARPCHISGLEEESLDNLIETAGNLLKANSLPHNP